MPIHKMPILKQRFQRLSFPYSFIENDYLWRVMCFAHTADKCLAFQMMKTYFLLEKFGKSMDQYIVVYITCASKTEADELAENIVADRLAACVNIINGVTSVFHWQGSIDRAEESLMILKTRKKLLKELINFVQLHHSYDVPEIIALPIVGGSDEYLNWLEAETLEL